MVVVVLDPLLFLLEARINQAHLRERRLAINQCDVSTRDLWFISRPATTNLNLTTKNEPTERPQTSAGEKLTDYPGLIDSLTMYLTYLPMQMDVPLTFSPSDCVKDVPEKRGKTEMREKQEETNQNDKSQAR